MFQDSGKQEEGDEGNGKPPHKIHFPRKILRFLSLVSAKTETEYATQKKIESLLLEAATKEEIPF